MAKVIGIKLGNHANFDDCKNRVYYYNALESYNIGDTVAVVLPGGKMVCVPVVETAESPDGNFCGIQIKKYVVGKVDDTKYREHKKAEKNIEEKRNNFQRAGYTVKNRIAHLVDQKTWSDWARADIGVLTLLGDYYLAKKEYEAVAGKDAADVEDALITKENDGLPY